MYVKGLSGLFRIKLLVLSMTLGLSVLMLPARANALAAYLAEFASVYTTHGATLQGCYSCNICHASALITNSTNLQNYGLAWKAAWIANEPGRTQDENVDASADKAFHDIESADSDGDGFTNVTEIMANSNPNVASSTPSTPNCTATTTGAGGELTQASTGLSDLNANALNAQCGFSSGAARIAIQKNRSEDPVQVLISLLLLLTPMFYVAYLKSYRFDLNQSVSNQPKC